MLQALYDDAMAGRGMGRPRSPSLPMSPRHHSVSATGRSSPGPGLLSGSPVHRTLAGHASPRPPSGLSGGGM